MRVRPNTFRNETRSRHKRTLVLGIVLGALGSFILMGWMGAAPEGGTETAAPQAEAMTPPQAKQPGGPAAVLPRALAGSKDGKWDGPVLYRAPGSGPVDLILVEKALQKLSLYRYDGTYRLIKTYACATGEKSGPKRREKDERTPVGIYFNTKSYRDNKITVFGDRAFKLNYPDPFDRIAGNGGNGIFIHGSNKKVTPNSTNGCVALDNEDLADLDKRVQFERTPVIIGDRLPYRFALPQRRLEAVLPFLQKAMVPESHAGKPSDINALTLIGYQGRVVAMGRLTIDAKPKLHGRSRLYLADAGNDLLVLFRREWAAEKVKAPVLAKAVPAPPPEPPASRRIKQLVESWRQAWQSERLEDYIGHYHSAFANRGRSLDQWKAYKANLNQRYKRISVSVSDLRVRVSGDRAKAYFKQRYRSDAFRSDGFKVLVLRKEAGRWKIYRENSNAQKPKGWPG